MQFQEEFKENVSAWIIAVNSLVHELKQQVNHLALLQEKDRLILHVQYDLIRQLRKEILVLKQEINFLKQKEGGYEHGRDIGKASNR